MYEPDWIELVKNIMKKDFFVNYIQWKMKKDWNQMTKGKRRPADSDLRPPN